MRNKTCNVILTYIDTSPFKIKQLLDYQNSKVANSEQTLNIKRLNKLLFNIKHSSKQIVKLLNMKHQASEQRAIKH